MRRPELQDPGAVREGTGWLRPTRCCLDPVSMPAVFTVRVPEWPLFANLAQVAEVADPLRS